MATYLQVENLTKSFGADVLFEHINFGIDEGEKVGLIAKNGAGKTTLLNILAGLSTADSGAVVYRNNLRVGYLPQVPSLQGALTVIEACLQGNSEAAQAVKAYQQALQTADTQALTKATELIEAAHAWDLEERFKQVLTKLKITNIHQPTAQLSGGEVKRVALAQLLIDEPQLLILDEPTNHLDIDMIEWLEDYLSRARIALLMVTHDRYFLDRVCSRILELDQRQLHSFEGNYNYYLAKRAERIHAQTAQAQRARNLLRTELEWMRRQPQARAHKAQYRINAFYDLQQRAHEQHPSREVSLRGAASYIGNKIVVAHHVSKQFDGKVILNDFNYTFARYEKLGIVGDNGVGKTTFIKLLLGQVPTDDGYFEVGGTVRFGYYSQQPMPFDDNKRVIDAVRDIAEYVHVDDKHHYTAMAWLGLFLFSPRDQQKLISSLSGGERRRLSLAVLLMQKPNFLILDEPTNDLDISTLEILEDYLSSFAGCVIIISHDRFFMDRTVDHTFVFTGDGHIKDFPGNYSDYRLYKSKQAAQAQVASKPKSPKGQAEPHSKPNRNKLTYKQQQQLQQLEADIDQLSQLKAQLETTFAAGDTTAHTDIMALSARYSQVTQQLDSLEQQWLELQELQSSSSS